MSGPYCQYCDHRCFVYRVLPDGSWSGHMATCPRGMEHDRTSCGYDHTTAINPLDKPAVADTPPFDRRYAEAVYEERFRVGDPRSKEYKDGFWKALMRVMDGRAGRCPYAPGTAQSDAWFAGNRHGQDYIRRVLEDEEREWAQAPRMQTVSGGCDRASGDTSHA